MFLQVSSPFKKLYYIIVMLTHNINQQQMYANLLAPEYKLMIMSNPCEISQAMEKQLWKEYVYCLV